MTIANAAILVGLARLTLAVTTLHWWEPEASPYVGDVYETGDDATCDHDFLSCLPTFYTTDCFDLGDRADRDECLRVELEDQAVAYTIGAEVYRRPVRLRQLPEPVHWKTLPPPFICHLPA
jgi:hypothetical protein